jgi:peptide/nickel transport system substrate-binding protein
VKSRRWRGWAAALLGAGALVLAGCGAAASTSGGIAPGLNSKSVTMVGGVQVEPNWYFPVVSAAACSVINYSIASQMYYPLLFTNTKDQIDYSKSIASGIVASHNDTVYTISLHHNWKWSNGQPVTAQDVVYSWDIVKGSTAKGAPWQTCGDGSGGVPTLWTSVVAKGPYTVVVTINKPTNPVWFEYNGIAANLVPIPKATWDRYPNMMQELKFINNIANSPSNPVYKVVDGPYSFGTYVNNEYWTLVANPKFTLKKATIKELLFEYETSNSNLFAGLRKGQFAYATIPTSYDKDVKQLPKYYQVQSAPYSFCFNYMLPNVVTTGPEAAIGKVFAQHAVREALQLGIDQPAIVQLMGGAKLATPGYSPVPKLPNNPFYDQSLQNPYPYNIQRGIKVLEADGWHLQNGVMVKNGQQLAFQFLVASGSTTNTNIAELIQADWAKEGIKATIKEEPFNQVIATNDTNFQFEWWGGGWCYGATDPTGDQLFSATSAANTSGYNNATMNTLIAQSIAPQSPAHAQQALDAYQQFTAKNLPVIFLPNLSGIQVVKTGLHGVNRYTNDISGYVEYNYWTVGSNK